MTSNEPGAMHSFSDFFRSLEGTPHVPARVVLEHRSEYQVLHAGNTLMARLSGKLRHELPQRVDWPAVGDWVAVLRRQDEDTATICGVAPRVSAFARKVAGDASQAQIVAANVDTVLIVSSLDGDFKPSRIERYLTVAWESGAVPVVVLNKADLCENLDEALAQLEAVALGVDVVTACAVTGGGIDTLRQYLGPGRTVALLGSSGVGKSSIINCLAGSEVAEVGEVRDYDGRGRHTTTHRELLTLGDGSCIIDTPGMRELQLWVDESSLEATFDDIEEIGAGCRFNNCKHESEPDCAVRQAVEGGTLAAARLAGYHKMMKELEHLDQRSDPRQRRQYRQQIGKIQYNYRRHLKSKRKGWEKGFDNG